MADKTSSMIEWGFKTLTMIAIALIAYFGKGFAASVEKIGVQANTNTNRIVAIESNRYTTTEAKADQEKTNDRIRTLEVNRASDSAKLDGIQNQLIALTQETARMNAKIDSKRGSP